MYLALSYIINLILDIPMCYSNCKK